MQSINLKKTLVAATLSAVISTASTVVNAADGNTEFVRINNIKIGADNNSAENPFVQPQDPAFSGGGRDQTMQFGDILLGTNHDDLLIGKLGTDVLLGRRGDDVIIGGIEHFNPLNRDRAFGGAGDDIFIWKPGDGSDLFRGGSGIDAVIFGITGENVGGNRKFEVLNDQQSADVFLNPNTGLPKVDVTNSPGFCKVIDESTTPDAQQQLNELEVDDLVQFLIRPVADSFESGAQSTDNGLRVTLHLQDVEVLVCTARNGGVVEILDLTTSPPQPINLHDIESGKLRARLNRIIK